MQSFPLKPLLTILLLVVYLKGFSQYYLRGEVKDDQHRHIPNVVIYLKSKGKIPFTSGNTGFFGIPLSVAKDSITLVVEGYETFTAEVASTKFQSIVLKPTSATASLNKLQLSSVTKDLFKEKKFNVNLLGESYNKTVENSFIDASKFSQTGFALNFNRASYSNIRRMLKLDYRIPSDAVRIEEILNYFNLGADSTEQQQFQLNTQFVQAPWAAGNVLMYLNLKAPKVDLEKVPPSNFTFLIDVSGSMDKANRLPLLKSAFKLLVKHLRPIDTVAIVVYGGMVATLLPPTSGGEKDRINRAIDELEASGDTPGEAAIKIAYRIAQSSFNPGANNRVILATDGDFNVGQSSEKELEELITQYKKTGIYLTCLGVGMGNYKDSKLQILAKKGNGNFAYIDRIGEAEKVLVTEFTQTMFSVANDAYFNIIFNNKIVKEYRLIGFDNNIDAMNDASSVLEGGELGSGQSIAAIFEMIPNQHFNEEEAVASIILNYKKSSDHETPVQKKWTAKGTVKPFLNADDELKLATAITMFGSLLKESDYSKNYNWDDVLFILNSLNKQNDVLINELKDLCVRAKRIYKTGRWKREKPMLFTTN